MNGKKTMRFNEIASQLQRHVKCTCACYALMLFHSLTAADYQWPRCVEWEIWRIQGETRSERSQRTSDRTGITCEIVSSYQKRNFVPWPPAEVPVSSSLLLSADCCGHLHFLLCLPASQPASQHLESVRLRAIWHSSLGRAPAAVRP